MMDERPEITVFSAFYDPWMSGAERFVKEVVERLSPRYHFTVYAARISRSVPARETRKVELPGGASADFDIVRVGPGTKFDKWLYCLLAPLAARKSRAEVAHAVMESYAGIALWILGILRPSVKRILTLQSGDLDSEKKQRRIPGWLWRRIHRSPHLVTAISGFLAARATKLGAERVEIVPNGVDLSRIRPRDQSVRVPHRVVCVARLSWEKGLNDLIEAMAEVRKGIPDATLVLVGDGALRVELEQKAKALGILEAVEFKGALPNAEALEVVKTAEVFACPSLAEGLGIVFIEAQACGVPTIGTRVGGIPDVIADGETGLLVPPSDAKSLAAAILRFMGDRGLADRCVAEALKRLSRFDWEPIVRQVADRYDAFLSAPSVLVAASIYPPDVGGPAHVVETFVRGWSAAGHEVTVVAPANGSSVTSDGSAALVRVAKSRGKLAHFRELLRRARRADVVFAQDASAYAMLSLAAAALARRPLVVRLGGDLLWERAAAEGKDPIGLWAFHERKLCRKASLAYRFALGSVFRRAAKVVLPSERLAETYVKGHGLPEAKAEVVLNPIPKIELTGGAGTKNRVLMAGRFVPLKNFLPTLDILKEVRGEAGGFGVLLVGEGPLEGGLRDWKARNGADWLEIRGAIPQKDLWREIASSKLVIQPSWSEVSPNLALESLTLGTPTVLTAQVGIDLGGAATFVEPGDAEAMKREVVRIMSDEGQREERAKAAAFSWPQTAEGAIGQYETLFREVCGS